jgi:hypothetical protein
MNSKLICFVFAVGTTMFGQPCFNSNLKGSYGTLATLGVGTAPTGTAPTFSTSPIGNLLKSIYSGDGSAAAATLYLDGNGRIFGSSGVSTFSQEINGNPVGTYAVDPVCTMRVTFSDIPAGITTTASAAADTTLVGLVAKGGDLIDLSQLETTATGTTPATGAGARKQRVALRMFRFSDAFSGGCSVATLRGPYALVGEGFSTESISSTTGTGTGGTGGTGTGGTGTGGTGTGGTGGSGGTGMGGTGTGTGTGNAATVAPYQSTFLARLEFDGTGKLISSPTAGNALLSTFQYGGTYTVNNDCSGTLSLTQQTDTGSSATPPTDTITARFLITPPEAFVRPSGILSSQESWALKPGLIFSIADSNKTVSGVGSAQ